MNTPNKVVLIHGKNTDPDSKWYPWFRNEVESYYTNTLYTAPTLPKADNPYIHEWIQEIKSTQPDQNTILVGHSRGGVAILRWLEQAPSHIHVKKIILIATNSGFVQKMAIPSESNLGFYTKEGYDFDAIKAHCSSFVVLHSKDDPWVPYSAGVENAKNLHAKFLSFDDRKHFGTGIDTIPELIEEIFPTSQH